MDKINESIHYWMSFIENACNSSQGSSHVIIVGSHADLVKSSQELKEKSSLVESIAESRAKQLTYGGFVSMDCRESKSKEARHFRSLLSTSQQAILSSQPNMSLYCHMLYAFLRTKLGRQVAHCKSWPLPSIQRKITHLILLYSQSHWPLSVTKASSCLCRTRSIPSPAGWWWRKMPCWEMSMEHYLLLTISSSIVKLPATLV